MRVVMMMRLRMHRAIMAGFTLSRPLQAIGWLATGGMATTVAAMGARWLR